MITDTESTDDRISTGTGDNLDPDNPSDMRRVFRTQLEPLTMSFVLSFKSQRALCLAGQQYWDLLSKYGEGEHLTKVDFCKALSNLVLIGDDPPDAIITTLYDGYVCVDGPNYFYDKPLNGYFVVNDNDRYYALAEVEKGGILCSGSSADPTYVFVE